MTDQSEIRAEIRAELAERLGTANVEWIMDRTVAPLLDALSAALAAKEAAEADAKWVRELLVSERAKHTQEREQWALTYVSEGTWRARAERAEAQRDEALTLLADAIPDPKGAMDSPQWHRRMDALARHGGMHSPNREA